MAGELQWHRADRQGLEVDHDGPVALAEQRGQLVEQAGLRPDPGVLDVGAELGKLDAVGLQFSS